MLTLNYNVIYNCRSCTSINHLTIINSRYPYDPYSFSFADGSGVIHNSLTYGSNSLNVASISHSTLPRQHNYYVAF